MRNSPSGPKILEIARSDSFASSPDPVAARANFDRLIEATPDCARLVHRLSTDNQSIAFLANILGGSPFLSDVLIGNVEWFDWLMDELSSGKTKSRSAFFAEARTAVNAQETPPYRIRELHRFHRRQLLRIGSRDLTCRVHLRDITSEISWLADAVIQLAFEEAWHETSKRFGQSDTKFAVIGVGKLGGEELNFSSDIDLIYVFSDECDAEFAMRLARRTTQILTEHTGDGMLYRVDLRLRPDGGRGPIASSIRALQTYYDSWGETFERLALTKARVVAGHAEVGDQFMKLIEPFVYRKYLDFAAIDEIRDIKVRIDQQVEKSVGLERHIKLGRGGIREIEFFVQVLQVLYGGEIANVRVRSTLLALDRLEEAHLVERAVARRLREAYLFLRNLEHKLQIVYQLQTHELPQDGSELQHCASRMKMTLPAFQSALNAHRDAVHQIFHDLFAGRTRLEEGVAGAVHKFIGHNLEATQTQEWLRGLGFEDPVRSHHILTLFRDAPAFGHSPSRMKNLLANVLTPLIEHASTLVRPDHVLNGFERLASKIGAREAFFISLLENPRSIQRLARIFALSDYLSEVLFVSPEVLDFLIDDQRLERPLHQPVASEDRKVQEFYVGAQYLLGVLPRRRATRVLTRYAERTLRGFMANEPIAIFAAGKFGERELNFRSDLDIIAFHEGEYERALHVVEDLTARLSSQFKVDMRLRPEGKKGSLVWPADRYREYLSDRGETWERMALTKARFVAGNALLGKKVQQIIENFVYDRHFGSPQIEEMRGIRTRMEEELGRETRERWNLKVGHGGLVDIEFLAEFFQIRHNIRVPNTPFVIRMMDPSGVLLGYYEFLRNVESMLRLWSLHASSQIESKDAKALGMMLGLKDFATEFKRVRGEVRKQWERREVLDG